MIHRWPLSEHYDLLYACTTLFAFGLICYFLHQWEVDNMHNSPLKARLDMLFPVAAGNSGVAKVGNL